MGSRWEQCWQVHRALLVQSMSVSTASHMRILIVCLCGKALSHVSVLDVATRSMCTMVRLRSV